MKNLEKYKLVLERKTKKPKGGRKVAHRDLRKNVDRLLGKRSYVSKSASSGVLG
jgi:hypothetical protein